MGLTVQTSVWHFEVVVLCSYEYLFIYEGESNENRKIFFKFNLLNESGTQLYHFST
jgi:hypothetical protein